MMNQQDAKRWLGGKGGEHGLKRIHLASSEPSRRHQRRRWHRRGYADQGQRAAAAQRRKDIVVLTTYLVAGEIASPCLSKAVTCRANIGVVIAGNDGDPFRRSDTFEPGQCRCKLGL